MRKKNGVIVVFMDDTRTRYFDIGIIGKPQGIKGEMRVIPLTDEPARFAALDEALVAGKDRPARPYAIEKARIQNNRVILKLRGVDDRTAAERLTGSVLKIPPEKALPLGEDEYYLRDLLGMAVWTDTGEKLGEVTDVLKTGANDVYAVRDAEGKEVLIPAVKQWVLSVSTTEKKIIVRPRW